MIQSFADRESELVWRRLHVRKLDPELQRIANRKLLILDAAETINDLRIPPGNRLERLHGNRAGQHSIRINDQWRICFIWTTAGPTDAEITDYHREET
ncbi:MAG: type II toxin-antitoxin system RelE/ParE family toxin [Galbitalea sp.]